MATQEVVFEFTYVDRNNHPRIYQHTHNLPSNLQSQNPDPATRAQRKEAVAPVIAQHERQIIDDSPKLCIHCQHDVIATASLANYSLFAPQHPRYKSGACRRVRYRGCDVVFVGANAMSLRWM